MRILSFSPEVLAQVRTPDVAPKSVRLAMPREANSAGQPELWAQAQAAQTSGTKPMAELAAGAKDGWLAATETDPLKHDFI